MSKGSATRCERGATQILEPSAQQSRYASGAHVREEQHVADGRRVGEQHDEAVDADAHAAGRRHAVLHARAGSPRRAHRLVVAGVLGVHLRLEALALVDGIDELGERVGVLAAE